MPSWLDRTTSYLDRLTAATSSPSRSVAASLRSTVAPLAPPPPRGSEPMPHGYRVEAEQFLRSTLARAASTATAWTEERITATTDPDGSRGSLFVSGEAILRRGLDPDAAADYATGRLLIAASQREHLLARERDEIAQLTARYRDHARHGSRDSMKIAAPEYAAAHLAATVATVRGRERILDKWPGWAGYFAAAESDRTTPEAAAAFISGPAPAIVRAAFALGREAEGYEPVPMPAEIEAMLDLARPHLASKWNRGGFLDAARAAVAAMLPPPGAEQPEPAAGSEPDARPTDGHEDPTPAEAEAIPGSEAEALAPDSRADHRFREEVTSDPERSPTKPGSVPKIIGGAGAKTYRVLRRTVERPDPATVAALRAEARPLVDALRRIQWESTDPPTVDHAQDSGEIDEGALAALAAWQEPRVFQRRQEQGRATVAVQILIDCSGSMGAGTRRSFRLYEAQIVGYAMATAFGSGRVRVAVAGHDVGYHEPEYRGGVVRFRSCPTPEAIAGLTTGGDNADGWAIAAAIDAVAAVPADRRAVFLLADGQPSADGYGGEGARKHIRSVVASGLARGIDFLAIGIEGAMTHSGPGLFGSRFVSIPDTRSAGPLLARIIGRIGKERTPCA